VPGSPPPLFAVGRVARAHGVRGRVLLSPYHDGSEGLESVRAVWLSRGAAEPVRFPVVACERVHLGYLLTLGSLDDRERAESLRGSEVLVAREELPPLAPGECWAADLVGCAVLDTAGVLRGRCEDLESAGPNELLVVALPSGARGLLPLSLVREADLPHRRLVAEVPEGLFEAQT
jgi:16S rRNA processing protein RimM